MKNKTRFAFLPVTTIALACSLLTNGYASANGTVKNLSGNSPDARVYIDGIPFAEKKPDFGGETCIAMYLQSQGHNVSGDEVFDAAGLDPTETEAGEVMSSPILTIDSEKSLLDANDLMANEHVRHLGVTQNGKLVGMISVRDLVVFLTNLPRK